MTKNKKFLSTMALVIVLGATLAFMANKKQPGNLYYLQGAGCGSSCLVAPCETTNNSGVLCNHWPLYTDEFCTQQYEGSGWKTTNGK